MRTLLDKSAPAQLKRLLTGHEVETAPERGWASKRNGALLELAVAEGFDVFVTSDKSIPHQQELSKFAVAVVVLDAGSNRMSAYEPLADELRCAVASARPGSATWVTA